MHFFFLQEASKELKTLRYKKVYTNKCTQAYIILYSSCIH